MEHFAEFLAGIAEPEHRARTAKVLEWVGERFPQLAPRIAWNQPVFTDHGTYIIGFSVAKRHLAVSPESAGIVRFRNELARTGYEASLNLFRIRWEQEVDYPLLERIVSFNLADKAGCASFWRK